ncbi:MAG: hypothetical protein KF871_03575 [Hydrogenophaga sp.]|uniref:hypothetical protein n=1 Tax=Hydrogenophaga sp. TaxID=1904254 RepID=UPI001D42AC3C|nr:hypothetical protein [Hydrogenophaga sp.]MBX3608952.1 hypothetical protein [Hydrogenophaga sp.]
MSTTLSAPSLSPVRAPRLPSAPSSPEGARRLSALLLAAAVATLVVIADQVIDSWADGHLMLAWVMLWALIFGGIALFADSARRVARRAVVALDGWSRSMAEARAEMRLWELAKQDPRLMSELVAARSRDEAEEVESAVASNDFSDALAPIGLPHSAVRSPSYWERLSESRSRNAHLFYI